MSEFKLYAEGIGPGAANVELCRLVDVVGHLTKGQPLMSALRQVLQALRTCEDMPFYMDGGDGDFARMVTAHDVWVEGREKTDDRWATVDNRFNPDGTWKDAVRKRSEGEYKRKFIAGMEGIAELKGRPGILEVLAGFVPGPTGLDGLKKHSKGRLVLGSVALRVSDAAELFGYGQVPGAGGELARASDSAKGHAPSANVVPLQLVESSTELAARAKKKAYAALENPPEDKKDHPAWAVARVAELTASGEDGVRKKVADKCGVTVRTVGNWVEKATAAAAEAKKDKAFATGIQSLTNGQS